MVFERYIEGKTLEGQLRRAERTIRARQLEYEPEELALTRLLGMRVPLTQPAEEDKPDDRAVEREVAAGEAKAD